MFKSILIANGRDRLSGHQDRAPPGLATVAIYSEADRDALHVERTDEAVLSAPMKHTRDDVEGANEAVYFLGSFPRDF
jgi:acetyl/propionyl-CoA carboxylase alpha subunit